MTKKLNKRASLDPQSRLPAVKSPGLKRYPEKPKDDKEVHTLVVINKRKQIDVSDRKIYDVLPKLMKNGLKPS